MYSLIVMFETRTGEGREGCMFQALSCSKLKGIKVKSLIPVGYIFVGHINVFQTNIAMIDETRV